MRAALFRPGPRVVCVGLAVRSRKGARCTRAPRSRSSTGSMFRRRSGTRSTKATRGGSCDSPRAAPRHEPAAADDRTLGRSRDVDDRGPCFHERRRRGARARAGGGHLSRRIAARLRDARSIARGFRSRRGGACTTLSGRRSSNGRATASPRTRAPGSCPPAASRPSTASAGTRASIQSKIEPKKSKPSPTIRRRRATKASRTTGCASSSRAATRRSLPTPRWR